MTTPALGAPVISAFTPHSGPTTGGNTLVFSGSDLSAAIVVTVGGAPCPIVAIDPTRVACRVPPGQGVGNAIEVTFSDGFVFFPGTYDYDRPFLDRLVPASGPEAGGIQLQIRGRNFGLSATVLVGGNPCPVVSQTHSDILCTLPPGTGLAQPVFVDVAGQVSNSLPFDYTAEVPAAGLAGLLTLALLLASALAVFRWRQRAEPR